MAEIAPGHDQSEEPPSTSPAELRRSIDAFDEVNRKFERQVTESLLQ
jgi:hypothetical protein